jgi:peroxiredoxin
MSLKVGELAPDFKLADTEKKIRSLSEFRGKKLVLAFFPGAFTGTCTKEMCAFQDSLTKLNGMNAQVVAVSVDSPFSNKEFAAKYKLEFPILSDYKEEVIKLYDIVHVGLSGLEGYTSARRSIFVLDKNGVVRYIWLTDNQANEPNYDEVTKALASMN